MTVPAAPAFGAPCPVTASPQTLALLASRRSASAQALRAPGPDAAQLADLLRLAARVPDHGKLAPWRFVVLEGEAKDAFVRRLQALVDRQAAPEKARAVLAKIALPPLTVAVISSPKPASIPLWEQQMSAGAVCMTLLLAAEAMGFGANWITDWYAFDPDARALLGVADTEQVAGFIHLGTPSEDPLERVRPDMSAIVQRWEA
ncbi:MAG: nitroreductase [Caulobacter vibrioides]|uniref:Putative NAD(P)H nitroreductase n=1 Tax=Caulobacter vibrioides TaxID=155892 RepID=A0A258D099_CAUVI|nr:MAG: nitroreductase [Caulobacter vibrioides]